MLNLIYTQYSTNKKILSYLINIKIFLFSGLFSVLLFISSAYAMKPVNKAPDKQTCTSYFYNFDQQTSFITEMNHASIELANKNIDIELTQNSITWAFSKNPEFDAYVNQGMVYLQLFHYIDALRSFKMAHKINPSSLYPIIGSILSYNNLLNSQQKQTLIKILPPADWLQCEHHSKKEKLWYNLALSVLIFSNKQNSISRKRLSTAYNNLILFDKKDLQTLTIATFSSKIPYYRAEANYQKALQIQPNHIGASHYLTHLKEMTGEYYPALKYSTILAKKADFNAHAVHMKGHILPRLGKWTQAKKMFQKADKIHWEWAKKNNVHPKEDWHYYHNLTLLAVAKMALGEVSDSQLILEKACSKQAFQNFSGPCVVLFLSYNIIHPSKIALSKYNSIIKQLPSWKQYLQFAINESALINGFAFNPSWVRDPHLLLVNKIIQSSKIKKPSANRKIATEIAKYIKSDFSDNRSDYWATSTINSLRILSVIAQIKNHELYNMTLAIMKDILTEFNFDLYNHFNQQAKKNLRIIDRLTTVQATYRK